MDMGPDSPEQEALTARAPDRPWPEDYDGARRSSRHGGSRDSPKKVVINKRHDDAKLEREYITSRISLRELIRRNAISAHSIVTVPGPEGRLPVSSARRPRATSTHVR
jgi:hypothetical protein